jgi:hypothetical protein
MFWIILCLIKNINLFSLFYPSFDDAHITFSLMPTVLITDWLCLAKTKLIIKLMTDKPTVLWSLIFVSLDVFTTILMLIILFNLLASAVYIYNMWLDPSFKDSFIDGIELIDYNIIFATPIYFSDRPILSLAQIAIPSTMLTSAWVILLLTSSLFIKLLSPLEHIRRLMVSWLDIDTHPLRGTAVVAATLIVIGAFLIKMLHWGWSMM